MFPLLLIITLVAAPAQEDDMQDGLTLAVLYDNYISAASLKSSWGFSCLVQGPEETILFDTGGNGQMLLSNADKLGVDLNDVSVVFLSHVHGDHTGGLDSVLKRNSSVTVYLPASFPPRFKQVVSAYGAKVVSVREPVKVCDGVFSTGQMGRGIPEQSLVMRTSKGLVVLTGCAHQGIASAIAEARQIAGGNVFLVLGGFHLGGKSEIELSRIIMSLKDMKVRYVAPCHCTGERAKRAFEKAWRTHYIPVGVGSVIKTDELR